MSIDTLSELAAVDEQAVQELPENEVLHAICRKLDIGKRLFETYAEGWKREKTASEVNGETYLQVAARLQATAERLMQIDDDSGMDLKLINSAFKALDYAERRGVDVAGQQRSLKNLLWGREGAA